MGGNKVTAGSQLQLRRELQFLVLLKACERLETCCVMPLYKVPYLLTLQGFRGLAPLWH